MERSDSAGRRRTGHATATAQAVAGDADERALVAAMDRLLELGGVDPARGFTRVAGRRLHYLDMGAGRPLVLLQGAGGGAANWYRLLGPLSARFRVLALDLPGFGRSESMRLDPPLGRRAAEVVDGWLDALGVDACAVVGTSFGGLIALRMADRPGSRVDRLVLLDAVGLGRELPLIVRLAGLPGLGRALLRPGRMGTTLMFERLLTSASERIPAEQREALVDYLWRSSATGDGDAMTHALRAFSTLGGQREVLSDTELGRIAAPTLVVWGERDRFLPAAHARRAAGLIPDARLALIAGVGHSPNWEAPDALLDVMLPFLPT